MVRPDLEARGLPVFAGLRRHPRGAARAVLRAWPSWSRQARAAAPPLEATRIVLRPTAVDDAGFTVVKDGDRFVVHGSKPSAGSARPTSPTTRPSATSPTGWPGSASRRRWSRPGREAGDEVVIGDGRATRCVFDWEPTVQAGAELLHGRRGARPAPRGTLSRPMSGRRRPASGRVVVKVGSSSLTGAGGRRVVDWTRPGSTRSSTRWPRRTRPGREVVLVSSGAIAAGLGPLGLARRPRDLATQQAAASVGQGLLRAPLHRGVRPARHHRRPGAAHRRRRRAARPLPQRPAHAEPAARARRAAGRQRERHGGHRRDPVRRQRPAGRPGRAPGARRAAGPALRRRRPLRRRPAGARRHAGSPRCAGDDDLVGVRLGRAGGSGVGTGGMATKVEAARIATAAGVRAVVASAEAAGDVAGRDAVGTVVHAGGGPAARPGCCGSRYATTPRGRLRAGRRRGARRRRAAAVAARRRA